MDYHEKGAAMSSQARQTPGQKKALAGRTLADVAGAMANPSQTLTRALDRHANAHDASHFLLIPQAVAWPAGSRTTPTGRLNR